MSNMINYSGWFNKYHRYLTGVRDGVTTYNDVKSKTLNKRYDRLLDVMSDLLNEQPYSVVGNYTGFQHLNELLEKSNYTFEDVNQSLKETYQITLQNAMSRMVVNTHCVIAEHKSTDRKHVHHDKHGHYYIIDVPFDQLHFGERDEFVRQKLHCFYETESEYYMPSDRFLSDEISQILGFTVICCTNGLMSDDWYVGISEQGFRFKIGWRYSSDVNFLIMKLDDSFVIERTVSEIIAERAPWIPLEDLDIDEKKEPYIRNARCIIQITPNNVSKSIGVPPNFGYFVKSTLMIPNFQNKTKKIIKDYSTATSSSLKTIKVRIYAIKGLREVNGVFPAVNFYDVMGAKYVYTEDGAHVTNDDGSRLLIQNIASEEKLPVCTPPISLSRSEPNSDIHEIIRDCNRIYDKMMVYHKEVERLGKACNTTGSTSINGEAKDVYYQREVLDRAKFIYENLLPVYRSYLRGAVLTSLISMDLVNEFKRTIDQFVPLYETQPSYGYIQAHVFDLLFGDNYQMFIDKMCAPLKQPPFTTIGEIGFPDYFNERTPDPVNRPVSEQCFITLKYNYDDNMSCWVFDNPRIKHFQGIDNVFYVDSNLKENDMYKFLYLYTTTENPSETKTVELTDIQKYDFDLFTKEVDRHIGYIRYWDVTNRLYKLSQMYYMNDDTTSEISILTKILKRKLSGDVFLEYASELNYESSNITSDNIRDYDELSFRAPFTINFLFYTLSMYYGNRDRLQNYIIQRIVDKKFYPRYSDLRLSELTTDLVTESLNYSVVSYSPNSLKSEDKDISSVPTDVDISIYQGLQFPVNNDSFTAVPTDVGVARYPYVFNVYTDDDKHYLLSDHEVDKSHFVKYSNVDAKMGDNPRRKYYDDTKLASMLTVYLSEVYAGINDLTTNYKSRWNQLTTIESLLKVIERHTNRIKEYLAERGDDLQLRGEGAENVLLHFNASLTSNPIYQKLRRIKELTRDMTGQSFSEVMPDSFTQTLIYYANDVLLMIRKIHEMVGFDRSAIRRLRHLYLTLKKCNEKMGLKEYNEWLNSIDIRFLNKVTDFYSDNTGQNIFTHTAVRHAIELLMMAIGTAKQGARAMQGQLNQLLSGDIQTAYIDQLVEYCDDVSQNCVFDMYVLNKVTIDIDVDDKPMYAEIRIDSDYVRWGDEAPAEWYSILSIPEYEATENGYTIHKFIPTCANAFRNMDAIQLGSMKIVVYNDQNEVIYTSETHSLEMYSTFTKVGLSSDIKNDTFQYIGIQTIPLEVQNVHETFDTDGVEVINSPHAALHYEMLAGNKFVVLDHTSEYCSPTISELQGPIDKLYLSCSSVNDMIMVDEVERVPTMYFRACEVFHIDPEDNVITSIGGKYAEGQTVYAVTDDFLYMFPMIITAVDHSQQHGLIEAKIDLQHTKWFKTVDKTVMHKYLTENITCTIVDDNIRNFIDEFTDYEGPSYFVPEEMTNEQVLVNLPGDPVYVTNNSEYVYTRLSWMFHQDIPNRYDDDIANRKHHFIYIGSGGLMTTEDDDNFILVNMINHDFNSFTLPQLYPVLRDEPDDHSVWNEEIKVFNEAIDKAYAESANYAEIALNLFMKIVLDEVTTEAGIAEIKMEMSKYEDKKKYCDAFISRMKNCVAQMETPSTWYNIRAYDDALVYINNGRAKLVHTFTPHIQDIPYSQELQVVLYDWENKTWINPSEYEVTINVEDGVSIDPVNNYNTNNVLTNVKITFADATYKSKRILIYFVYDTSDVFDDIEMNDMECQVRFQPVMDVYEDKSEEQPNPYGKVRVRKNYDENEIYRISKLRPLPESFGQVNGFIFDRPSRSGYYTTGSPIRFCDMILKIGDNEYDYTNFDIYIPHPFGVDMTYSHHHLTYTTTIVNIDGEYEIGDKVTLISVNNDDYSTFGVSASSVTFEGEFDDIGSIKINSSTIDSTTTHTFTCAILPSKHHNITSGVVIVSVTSVSNQEPGIRDWFHLSANVSDFEIGYRLIPEHVALIPHEGIVPDASTILELRNNYDSEGRHAIYSDNTNSEDMFYYWQLKPTETRYPIGDVLTNNPSKRLVFDYDIATDVRTIRSNHIGICRYASQKIPKDGIIDLTGYIPTPLSRDRYEFWVNGRYISDPDNVLIISPTVIQLRGLKSLRNLDIVELVDDISVNAINKKGSVYIDMDGKVYTSYLDMMKHHANVANQDLQFLLNQDISSDFDLYVIDKLRQPNNVNLEADIMDMVTSSTTNYDKLHNIPSINGEPLFNITSYDLGLMEYPNSKLLGVFDKTWKREGLQGITPFKHLSRYIDTKGKNQVIHIKETDDAYELYFTGLSDLCFTIYITNRSVGDISDVTNTHHIIPMVRPGVRILLNKSLKGKWIRTTIPNTIPIKIK